MVDCHFLAWYRVSQVFQSGKCSFSFLQMTEIHLKDIKAHSSSLNVALSIGATFSIVILNMFHFAKHLKLKGQIKTLYICDF